MSLIEKAVERLDKLKQAGAQISEEALPLRKATNDGELKGGVIATPVSAPVEELVKPEVAASKHPTAAVEIDLARLATLGMVTPNEPKSPIAEQYRLIKRPLIQNAQGRGASAINAANLIMVTSSLPGEGKSFTAINLAMSIAMELDHTVLLVDADVSKPSVLKTLGLKATRGLMDVLVGDKPDLSEVLLRTNVDKLSILPAGMAHPRATELLASDGMNQLLDEIATRYSDRIVIFDSPPLLVTTESRTLATHMGQVVMVVEANRTTHATVQHAIATIDACPVKMILLNKAGESGPGGYYGYGYGGYGYGYGYGAGEERAEAA